ncbi:hypothetical protein H9L21_02535 [Aeromicrobium senzhongii]|uniref:Uncharacterized protein n=1 Tax=Aeromicrobium senzhongii TaxID=2663859 RepID=A0ABX6SWP9_9ACTN|nr:hypothetical protein [Aeromicrobium senzhongii]QNL95836.1 hypothetical protein H9L21_02535 [Aeromicrobium senzhongii]
MTRRGVPVTAAAAQGPVRIGRGDSFDA